MAGNLLSTFKVERTMLGCKVTKTQCTPIEVFLSGGKLDEKITPYLLNTRLAAA